MNREDELRQLYIEASDIIKRIHDFDYRQDDEKFNSIMDDLLEVQQKNNQLLVQVLSKLRTFRQEGKEKIY